MSNGQEFIKNYKQGSDYAHGFVTDIERNPERYIHFSVLGRKEKVVKLTPEEEKKLREMLK